MNRKLLYALAFAGMTLVGVGIGALLVSVTTRQVEAAQYPLKLVEIADDEIDPSVWGQNFPVHYNRYMMTATSLGQTPYGGSDNYSKLERNPALVRLWAGYAFSKDHNEDRGHFYSQIDQANTQRVKIVNQPGACANCHAGEAPLLIAEMGWEAFNHTPYNDLLPNLHTGSTCADCHDPQTMALRLTRPGLINALAADGIDWTKASRQEMRTYVCAQCHVEYYFAGENKILTFPWADGKTIDDIQVYYDRVGHIDWKHADTGGGMLKMQHPEYELFTTSTHYSSGVSCADCHMPYIREGGVKVSDHWWRSPLFDLNASCGTCHNIGEEALEARVSTIQDRTAKGLHDAEAALIDAIDAIKAAKEAGATDEDLAQAFTLHRHAQMRWDFISSDNSTGFHSPQESARVLGDAMNLARQAQIEAIRVLAEKGGAQQSVSLP
jgi:nitrite reductase (cytochrome c-552)